VSSIEPNDGGDELDGGEEVALSPVVAGGNSAKLLEPGEEILDQMARLEEVAIIATAELPIGPWWDHRDLAGSGERLDDAFIGIERFIGDERIRLHGWQELIGAHKVMGLATGQVEANGVAQRVDQGMDLGAQSTP